MSPRSWPSVGGAGAAPLKPWGALAASPANGLNDVSLPEKLREVHGLEIYQDFAAESNEKAPAAT